MIFVSAMAIAGSMVLGSHFILFIVRNIMQRRAYAGSQVLPGSNSNSEAAIMTCGSISLFSVLTGLLDFFGLASYGLVGFPIFFISALVIVVLLLSGRVGAPTALMFFLGFFIILWIFEIIGPAKVFNPDDDLAKYFVQMYKVFGSGTSYLGPLGPTSGASLGAAPFLQSFILGSIEDVGFIAYWDLAVSLAAWLVFGLYVIRFKGFWSCFFYIFAGLSTFFVFHAMYVNISAIYLPACITAIVSYFIISDDRQSALRGMSASVFYGCSMGFVWTLKPTFLLSIAAVGALHAVLLFLNNNVRLSIVRFAGFILGCSFVHWIWTLKVGSSSNVVDTVSSLANPRLGPVASDNVVYDNFERAFDYLLSSAPNFYGFGGLSNATIVFMLAATALASLTALLVDFFGGSRKVKLSSNRRFRDLILYLFCFSSACLLGFLVLALKSFGGEEALPRYIIGNVLVVPLVIVIWFSATDWEGEAPVISAFSSTAIATFFLYLGVSLSPFFSKLSFLRDHQTMLSFPAASSSSMRAYTEYVLSDDLHRSYGSLQGFIDEGEPIAVLVGASFHFDFSRNEVFIIEPTSGGPKAAREFLDSGSVRYVVRQLKGGGVRTGEQWRQVASASPFRRGWATAAAEQWEAIDQYFSDCQLILDSEAFQIVDLGFCALAGGEDS